MHYSFVSNRFIYMPIPDYADDDAYLESDEPMYIKVEGHISGQFQVGSNKTIIGTGSGAEIPDRVNNEMIVWHNYGRPFYYYMRQRTFCPANDCPFAMPSRTELC
jgi:hypothetical protein